MKIVMEQAKKGTTSMQYVRELRGIKNENQTQFWQRFGVTQSRGSRFEKGEDVPTAVALLIELYRQEKVSDKDLHAALQNISLNDESRGRYD